EAQISQTVLKVRTVENHSKRKSYMSCAIEGSILVEISKKTEIGELGRSASEVNEHYASVTCLKVPLYDRGLQNRQHLWRRRVIRIISPVIADGRQSQTPKPYGFRRTVSPVSMNCQRFSRQALLGVNGGGTNEAHQARHNQVP